MKKLVIAAAIVLAAVASQASAIAWSTAAIKDHLGTNVRNASPVTFTAICTIWDSTGENVLYTSSAIANNAMSQFKSSWNDAAPSTTYQAQIVITSSDGWTLTSEKATLTPNEADPYSLNFSNGQGFKDVSAKLINSGTNYGWQNVPEPTSGLLLLLGVAGLALKRKRV